MSIVPYLFIPVAVIIRITSFYCAIFVYTRHHTDNQCLLRHICLYQFQYPWPSCWVTRVQHKLESCLFTVWFVSHVNYVLVLFIVIINTIDTLMLFIMKGDQSVFCAQFHELHSPPSRAHLQLAVAGHCTLCAGHTPPAGWQRAGGVTVRLQWWLRLQQDPASFFRSVYSRPTLCLGEISVLDSEV